LKIAIIHFTSPPLTGGVERVVDEQIKLLRANGHTVSLASFEGGRAGADSFVPLSRTSSCSDFLLYLASALSGNDVVLMHNVCVIPQVPELTEALRQLPGRLPSVRWICWVHDFPLADPGDASFSTFLASPVFATPCADWEYVAVSAARAHEVEECFAVPCAVIPNGVDPAGILGLSAQIAAIAEKQGWWDADAVLLQPSRLQPRKNIETGIRLVSAARERGVDLRMLLTGSGDLATPAGAAYVKYLETLAISLKLQEVVCFLGASLNVGPKEFAEFNQVADVLFFAGTREGFGLPVLEAGVMGKPVFCPNGEPLNGLPGAITYPSDSTIEELADWLIGEIRSDETIMARRKILRDYRWPSIYLNHLEPLLQRSPLPHLL
jgi:glycosyltransferase involved in cell wall biosynthesis